MDSRLSTITLVQIRFSGMTLSRRFGAKYDIDDMKADTDRAHGLAARRIECVQRISGCKPDALTVKGNSIHPVDTRKGPVFTQNFSFRSFHAGILPTWYGARE